MLTGNLVHPAILGAAAAAGHGSLILVADGNFPASTKIGRRTDLVHLGLTPGLPSVMQIVSPLLEHVPVEAVIVMQPDVDGPFGTGDRPLVWSEIESALCHLGITTGLSPVPRQEFYDLASSDANALTVVSADTAWFSNVMLRVGPRATLA